MEKKNKPTSPERRQVVKMAQAKRRQRLQQAAILAGYPTIDKLAEAIIKGELIRISVK